MAHSLKTPINQVIGINATLLASVSEEMKEAITVSNSACDILLNTIDNLEDMSKFEINDFVIDFQWISLTLLAQHIRNVLGA